MAKFINVGDTIEADKAECIARKFVLGIPKKHPITQKIMLLVTTDRNVYINNLRSRYFF